MTTDSTPSRVEELLVVEDSAAQQLEIARFLEKGGYRVRTANNGVEALAAMAARPPTIVLSDVVMPEMDGYELCRRIKQDARFRDIPVILITALSDPKDVVHGLECGADNFVVKPYDHKYLLSRIAHVISEREVRRTDRSDNGTTITIDGQHHVISAGRRQILDLLLSTYEAAMMKNAVLSRTQSELQALTAQLEQQVEERTAALTTEIAERKRAAADLARSNAELRQFADLASHDLQEPLRMVATYVQLLARRYTGKLDADADDFIGYAVDGALRMQQLIADLLHYSSIGTRAKALAPTDSEGVLAGVLAALGEPIAASGATVTHDPLPPLMADATQLGEVLEHLIGNAIKFRGAVPPRVHVSAERHDASWRFAVRDNGIGIAPQYFERIFLVFQRLHARDAYPGTGVGLAICKRIVERHGGRIWVESAPGQGATFFFTIPNAGGDVLRGQEQRPLPVGLDRPSAGVERP